jgi:hypothetical protein
MLAAPVFLVSFSYTGSSGDQPEGFPTRLNAFALARAFVFIAEMYFLRFFQGFISDQAVPTIRGAQI